MKKFYTLLVMLILTACSSQKSRYQQLMKELEKTKQASSLKDSLQSQSSTINATLQQVKEGVVLEMDELFYWHPDSGLQQQPGYIKVKVYKSSSKDSLARQSHQQQSSTVKAQQQEQELLKKTTYKVLEKEVERKGSFTLILLAMIFLGLVILGLWWSLRLR
ncbi:hypothetical protein [Pedobacter glucosidilyticus]|uniref:hypothetical protein n=1 Tax=Pedobacter glucosidilyticus TaxID=1122941 RepID=UPI0012DFAE26|nr:hypothetical protein [Pedobacter glucosidilyticus]